MIPKLAPFHDLEQLYVTFLQELTQRGFKGEINSDFSNRVALSTDNSIYQVLPQGVVYPTSKDDLVTLARLAGDDRFKDVVITPRGGGTGTNGQSLTDGVVVDISRHMNKVLEINAEERWVRVQTGVVKDQLNAALKPFNLFFAPDLSTSNRATIGGMINTDASGQGSCVYGKTRDHVLELETILADGTILSTRALEPEERSAVLAGDSRSDQLHAMVDDIFVSNQALIDEVFPPLNRCMTGYDLAHIHDQEGRLNLNNVLCGSEGTLGLIAEAKLNVLPIPRLSALVLVKYADFNSSLRDATELMRANPTSVETIDSKVLGLAMQDFIWHQVEEFFAGDNTDAVRGINLVEFTAEDEAGLQQKIDGLTALLETGIAHQGNTTDFNADTFTPSGRLGYSIALGHDAVNRIWAMRKRAVGLLGNAPGEARPIPFVEDTAVPPENLADFILEFREILDSYQLQYGMFGHVDAGVLHVRPALDMKDPKQEDIAWEISDRIADLCHQYGGLLWGEHGKGVRSEYAPKFFGALYPQLQKIKAAFDPHNQLNPGKIATPSAEIELLEIDGVPTRGQHDRQVSQAAWRSFSEAVYCNGNGACYNWNPADAMCPSYKGTRDRIHSPKGRASLVRSWLKMLSDQQVDPDQALKSSSILRAPGKLLRSLNKKRNDDFSHQVYDAMAGCLSCKACASQCPIKVDVPEFRAKFIALYHTRYLRPLKDYLVGTLEFVLPWCAKVPALYNGVMSASPAKALLEKWVGFVDGPLLSKNRLRNIPIASARQINKLSTEQRQKTVVIVQDAFTSYFEAPLVQDLAELMRTMGFTPLLAPYKANGKPLHVHGFLNGFRRVAQRNTRMLQSIAQAGLPLVGVDPSMTHTYRMEYKKFLPEGTEAPQVQLIQEWLADNIEALKHVQFRGGQRFTLLPHCIEQSHATKARDLWADIFAAAGQQLDTQSLGCCGMSGTYGHEARNRDTSRKIYQLSWHNSVDAHNADELLATGYSCRSQVKREAQKQIRHPLQALLSLAARNIDSSR
ncbi:FAD-binding and (Fe-S)-binding domain-containing protein [Teredinibacter turnerae]|uniref:D-2-hydroxyglutarate dehydrogenase YdiJ n=1 Tax=Teredinibacter turnerae TaxID=2426 RepID=UPI00037BA449|nr:FAD-binding and (Fe-S)-binding domain-containing protein [Teredinibacter turnerae]